MITIDEALIDPNLFGAALGNPDPWAVWRAILKGAFALPMGRDDVRAFRSVAGRRRVPRERVAELWAVAGRRGGKSRMAALIASYVAAFEAPRVPLAPGEIGHVLVLSPSKTQARTVKDYVLGFLEASPILAPLIESTTAETIRLTSGIHIGVHTNSFRTVRGRTLIAAIFDESAFWRSEESASPDTEVYTAVLPALATTGGMLIGISSPYRKAGLLHQKHRDHFGRDSDTLVIQAATRTLNPTVSERVIARARESDPEAARAEWDGLFRADISSLLDDAMIDEAIDADRPIEIPRREGVSYVAFADASAGRHDAFTAAIGHVENGVFVADVVRGRKPPFDPDSVAKDYAALAKSYGCRQITGDAYAGEWVAKAFEKQGVTYRQCPVPKSALYLEGLPAFARRGLLIPNDPVLIRELRLLERRTSRSGRDSVDHPQNGTDDHANALFGALYLATSNRMRAPQATIREFSI